MTEERSVIPSAEAPLGADRKRTRAEVLHERRISHVRKLFAGGRMSELLDGYLRHCGVGEAVGPEEGEAEGGKSGRRSAHGERRTRLPNPAGFCRYLSIERSAFGRLESEFPTEIGQIRAVFEDEALNSELSASVLGFYLKYLVGTEEREGGETDGGEILVSFEHDILADGR